MDLHPLTEKERQRQMKARQRKSIKMQLMHLIMTKQINSLKEHFELCDLTPFDFEFFNFGFRNKCISTLAKNIMHV